MGPTAGSWYREYNIEYDMRGKTGYRGDNYNDQDRIFFLKDEFRVQKFVPFRVHTNWKVDPFLPKAQKF